MSVIDILEELEGTSGSNAKKEILETHVKNKLLKRVFIAAQDPYMVYHVNKFKMPPAKHEHPDDEVIKDFLDVVLPELSSRRMTGNNAKTWVNDAFARMDEIQQKWCQRILLHNLRCGVQETTVNKIWPGSIKSFSVALACTLKSSFKEGEGIKILEPVNYPVRVEPKLDGLRCIAVKQKGVVTFYTRNGTVLETLPRIKAALEAGDYDDTVLDGEAMGEDWNESASVLMSSKSKKDDSNIFYNVFDALPLNDWVEQQSAFSYEARCVMVSQIVVLVNSKHVRQVPHINAKDEKQIKEFFAKCMNEGYEGVMLKRMDTPYEFDRSKNILKLKPVTDYTGIVCGWYEGRRGTKREGLFGGFDLLLQNGVITRVGGGFNDKDRAEIQLKGPDTYIGKAMDIEAQPDPLTKDGLTVDGKARFPVFVRWRDLKDVDKKITDAYKVWRKD